MVLSKHLSNFSKYTKIIHLLSLMRFQLHTWRALASRGAKFESPQGDGSNGGSVQFPDDCFIQHSPIAISNFHDNQKVGQSFLPSNEYEMPNFVPWKLTYNFKRKAKMVCLFGDPSHSDCLSQEERRSLISRIQEIEAKGFPTPQKHRRCSDASDPHVRHVRCWDGHQSIAIWTFSHGTEHCRDSPFLGWMTTIHRCW